MNLVVYDLMRRIFNRKLGLWAMFLLAVCPWHIMMSHWGLDVNLASGFLIFGLYFFILGVKRKNFYSFPAFVMDVFFLFSSLVGGGVNCLIVTARLHQVDGAEYSIEKSDHYNRIPKLQFTLLQIFPQYGG